MISDAAKIIEFPRQVSTGLAQLKSWHSDDEAWTGYWNNFPEGVVNMEEMNLTEEADLQIQLKSVGGEISGTISSKAFCGRIQTFHFIRGNVGRNSGEIVMWDIILGIGRDLTTFSVTRENGVLVVKPISGDMAGLPAISRLGKFPGAFDENQVAEYGDCGEVKKLGR